MGVSISKQVENAKKKNEKLAVTIKERIAKSRQRITDEETLLNSLVNDLKDLTGKEPEEVEYVGTD